MRDQRLHRLDVAVVLAQRILERVAAPTERLRPLRLVRPTQDEAAVMLGLDHQDGARGQGQVVDLSEPTAPIREDDVIGHLRAVAFEHPRDGALAEQAAQLR